MVAELGEEYRYKQGARASVGARGSLDGQGVKLPSAGVLARLASLASFRRALTVHEAWTRVAPGGGGGGRWVRTTAAAGL